RNGFRLILVSNAVSWTRQRFILAHELGHVLAGDAQNLRVDLDVMAPSSQGERTEMRANAFASAFLMPARTITESWRDVGQDTRGWSASSGSHRRHCPGTCATSDSSMRCNGASSAG
ncbi:MAG: ImmA/IrrE family metallo-endopeptidase, partial [Pseudonocardiales bacterium]|nr:ImmA/IrrE family metallo-endopeptidase [Pseudonocardiales bacterium]